MIARLASVAMVVAVIATGLVVSWSAAFAVALAGLAVRMVVLAWRAARRELPWTRLLLPGIIVLEAARASEVVWQVRLGLGVALEVALVVVAIRELRRTSDGAEPLEVRIARALEALLPPRIARLVAFELVLVGSALRFMAGGWRREVPAGFAYHRESGLRFLLPLLPLLAIGDILLLELVILPHAATWVRIVVHVLAIYSLIWLIGLYASVRARPHQLVEGRLILHRGMLARLEVPVDQITSIEALPSFADDWKKRAYLKGALRLDVAGPTILELRSRTPARRIGVLGEITGTRVLLAVDDPAALSKALASHQDYSGSPPKQQVW